MKIYVAARDKRKQEIRELYQELEKLGHRITLKWTDVGDVKMPYRDNLEHSENRRMVQEFIVAASSADCFILLSEPGMRGAYVELGAFLVSAGVENKRAYIVGGKEQQHVFESHPAVIITESIEEVMGKIKND